MISFKSFIYAIHDAIMKANDSFMDKHTGFLDKYFEDIPSDDEVKYSSDSDKDDKKNFGSGYLRPKSVVVQYPYQTEKGVEFTEVHVPLITLVPFSMAQIEKARIWAQFEMEIVNDELQLNFIDRKSSGLGKKSKTSRGTLEVTFAPQESSEGLKQLIEGYEKALKRQIPS